MMQKKDVRSIGEFGLIDRVLRRFSTAGYHDRGLVVGPGDDAFAACPHRGMVLLGTKDMLVEGVHFDRRWCQPYEIGYKAMVANYSDLAAMGGAKPLYILLGVALPKTTPVEYVDKLSQGIAKAVNKYGGAVVGGDTVSSTKSIVISITLIGEIRQNELLLRSKAQIGDFVMVTGTFGDSCGGLFALKNKLKSRSNESDTSFLVKRHLMPQARMEESRLIASHRLSKCMIDSSDGLLTSLDLMAQASGVGIQVDMERVPVSPALRALAQRRRRFDFLSAVLNGGEEYELVFTARPSAAKKIQQLLPRCSIIGTVTAGKKVRVMNGGREIVPAMLKGFKHF